MLWKLGKSAMLAAWSVVLGYFIASLVAVWQPGFLVAPDGVFVAAVALALLIFPGLWIAFRRAPAAPPRRFPERIDAPTTGCPTCYAEMHLVGVHTKQGRTPVYLWVCERDHGWARQGEHPGDSQFPWQACQPSEMMGAFFG